MLKPIFTEKSVSMSKHGKYAFWVSVSDTKESIKSEIKKVFDVTVTAVKTITLKGETGRTARGRKFAKSTRKKAIVTLKDKEKIDIYEKS